jgi:protein-disulfide isomerase
MKASFSNCIFVLLAFFSTSNVLFAREAAVKIGGKTFYDDELAKENEGEFFRLEKEKFDLIEQMARQKYLDFYWEQQAKSAGKSVEAVRKAYMDKNLNISSKEITSTLERFKDHPQLQKLGKKEQEDQIRDYLTEKQKRELTDAIIEAGIKKKDLVILLEKPKEPVYKVTVNEGDHVRYGPGDDDIKPVGCSNDCPITVVEYSEFQCPFCARVMPSVKKLLVEYKGKMRWIMRDFPLSFHDRARPAAIAAHCAGDQKKFWHMYSALFDNQRDLSDKDLEKYASKIKGLDQAKWKSCLKDSKKVEAVIDTNIQEGTRLGVTGTPAFFINGRRISGAVPYEEFKRVFDEELSSKGKRS